MREDIHQSGLALIKRCVWFATRVSFIVLAPVSMICFAAAVGSLAYKCGCSGLSPLAFFRSIDKDLLAKVIGGLIATIGLTVLGVGFCAGVGTLIGALAAGCRVMGQRSRRKSLRS
jgi:hypothetical protein